MTSNRTNRRGDKARMGSWSKYCHANRIAGLPGDGMMRIIAIASLVLAAASGAALAQGSVAGQPTLMAPQAAPAPAKPSVAAKPTAVAKPATGQGTVKPATTPEQRSAAQLALSADPVFDEDT